jgi:hypothetical protein
MAHDPQTAEAVAGVLARAKLAYGAEARGCRPGLYAGLSLEYVQAQAVLDLLGSGGYATGAEAALLITMLVRRLGGSVVLAPDEVQRSMAYRLDTEQGAGDTFTVRVLDA